MDRRLIVLKDIKGGESNVLQLLNANPQFIEFLNKFEKSIDVLLQLMYFPGPKKDIKSEEGLFRSYSWTQYLQAPYSFRAAYILFERAYYSESIIIIRSLLEMFIQIRYSYWHKDKIKDIWGLKKRIRFKDMFEEIVSGYYDKYYGKQFSAIAHRKIIADIFRVKRTSATEAEVIMVPTFDKIYAGYVLNNLVAFLYGYLNLFPIFFKEGFYSVTSELSEQYKDSIKELKSYLDKNKKAYPEASDWYSHIEKITNP